MGGFITLDAHKLLNGELRAGKSSSGKITFIELGKCLRVKLRLELFQNIGEF